MVQRITTVIKEYHDKLREMPYVPKTSFERETLGFCGEANKLFVTFLFEYHLAHYMFAARCKAQGISQFSQFLAIAAATDWPSCTTTVTSRSGAT
jgi:hypothetical protein